MSVSILDQVINSQNKSARAEFDAAEIITKLFAVLNDREKEILARRHGLMNQEKSTLEEIGKQYNVTRERVRQVENSSLKKIRESFDREILKAVEHLTGALLQEYGGAMSENNLIHQLTQSTENKVNDKAAVSFLLNQLLADRFQAIKETPDYYKTWAAVDTSWDDFMKNLDRLVEMIKVIDKPVELNELIEAANEAETISWNGLDDSLMRNILDITKHVDSNIYDEWGLTSWSTVKPKRMNDKIYLVLKKKGKPMHFTEIAQAINDAHFDNRTAYPATIHNELILDPKFVLVGRGIYALTEWGYKPGVVADVIEEVLRLSPKPLTKDQIVAEVMKNRIVKKSTIILALMNKNRFTKNKDKTYSITQPV